MTKPPAARSLSLTLLEAAKMGADAAVLVYDKTKRVGTVVEGPWWSRSRFPVYGRKIVAVGIRFTGS